MGGWVGGWVGLTCLSLRRQREPDDVTEVEVEVDLPDCWFSEAYWRAFISRYRNVWITCHHWHRCSNERRARTRVLQNMCFVKIIGFWDGLIDHNPLCCRAAAVQAGSALLHVGAAFRFFSGKRMWVNEGLNESHISATCVPRGEIGIPA